MAAVAEKATDQSSSSELPITERANELTDKLDLASPLGMVSSYGVATLRFFPDTGHTLPWQTQQFAVL